MENQNLGDWIIKPAPDTPADPVEDRPDLVKDLYGEWVAEDLDYIRFLNSENKVFQELRENHQGIWEIVELCREALFDNAKLIKFLIGRIEDDRAKIKKLS